MFFENIKFLQQISSRSPNFQGEPEESFTDMMFQVMKKSQFDTLNGIQLIQMFITVCKVNINITDNGSNSSRLIRFIAKKDSFTTLSLLFQHNLLHLTFHNFSEIHRTASQNTFLHLSTKVNNNQSSKQILDEVIRAELSDKDFEMIKDEVQD